MSLQQKNAGANFSVALMYFVSVSAFIFIGAASAQQASVSAVPASAAGDVASMASAIADGSASVTQIRASVVRSFAHRIVAPAGLSEALVDADPRYRDNLVGGLRIGIPSAVISGPYRPYVWGGTATADYPYVVAVVGTREICSGVVLNGNVVLTASHCFCNNTIRAVHTGAAVFRGTAVTVVGTPKLMEAFECDAERGGVDVGVLYLPLATSLPSARLATQAELASLPARRPNVLRLVGYGLTKDGNLGAKSYADLPVASTDCSGSVALSAGPVSDAEYYGCQAKRELVAGAVGLDVDACGGDSGAPLILEDGTLASVVAISSRSVSRRRSCGDGAVYVLFNTTVLNFLRIAITERP